MVIFIQGTDFKCEFLPLILKVRITCRHKLIFFLNLEDVMRRGTGEVAVKSAFSQICLLSAMLSERGTVLLDLSHIFQSLRHQP